ncbi:IS3 family transposase [Carnobacterium maltaromaticum]
MQFFVYVQGFYNTRRIHSALARLTPSQFEQHMAPINK